MASDGGYTAVAEFTEENSDWANMTKWSGEKEGNGHSVFTDQEGKVNQKNVSHKTSTWAGN